MICLAIVVVWSSGDVCGANIQTTVTCINIIVISVVSVDVIVAVTNTVCINNTTSILFLQHTTTITAV